MTNFLNEFKQFINRGNVIDLAIGVVIGGAFGRIVASLVGDVVLPILDPLMGDSYFSELKLGPILIGHFIAEVINFLIIALVIFMVVKAINRFKKKEEAKPAEPTAEVKLLAEIRDALKNK